jgi:AraC family transcriptional regulator of adaptative response / DNA-3-methyladenine glycosylase II
VRAVIGQQVSVTGARTIAGRLVRLAGEAIADPIGGITHLFPTPEALIALAEHDPAAFAMPGNRRRALVALAEALRSGTVTIDPGTDPAELRAALVQLPGIGPWTAEYVAMRALRDPDAFMPSDLGVRRAARALGQPDDPAHLIALTEEWRPWRSYAMVHLWAMAAGTPKTGTPKTGTPTTKRSLRGRDAA